MPSAYNSDSIGIPPGFAVVVNQDRAKRASTKILASAIVTSGAGPKGVLSITSSGILELKNWSLSTGSQLLSPGASYYAIDGGKIGPGVGGQYVGSALSGTELQINVAPNLTPYIVLASSIQPPLSNTTIISGIGAPAISTGKPGDYYVDKQSGMIYGPKLMAWGAGVFPSVIDGGVITS